MQKLKRIIKSIPILGDLAVFIASIINRSRSLKSSEYWEVRYRNGGTSGAGSYNNLATFKAEVINAFIKENEINSAIEFGCGDGNQLGLISYPNYVGIDISKTVINQCRIKFKNDRSKSFLVYNSSELSKLEKADLTLSLDVIYHLIEDEVFQKYMTDLFNFSQKYVIIYSSNVDKETVFHERDRKFTSWVEENIKDFTLIKFVPNKFPEDANSPNATSKADFYIYKRV